MPQRQPLLPPVVRMVFLLVPRRPVPVRLIASARETIVSPSDVPDAQTGTGNADDCTTQITEPLAPSMIHTRRTRFWHVGLLLALLALLGAGAWKGLDIMHELQAQNVRLAVAVGQQQEQLHALSFTLQALRTEFGVVTDELLIDPATVPVTSPPPDLATVALSPAETRSLTSLMEQVTTQGQQLGALAKEIARLRSAASTPALPSSSRYRAPIVTPSESLPSQDPPSSYAVTLPPALGVTGFTPARSRRTRVPR